MKIEVAKIKDLIPMEKNVRLHTTVQIKELQRSFRMFGQTRPVVVDEKNMVMIGHGFLEAIKEIGEETVQVYRIENLKESQKKKLMLTDNKTFELGGVDSELIMEVIRDIKMDDDLNIPGFDEDILKQLTMSELDLDGVIENYASLSDEKINEIRTENKKELKIKTMELDAEKIHVEQENENEPAKPYAICPSCGDKVWL